jgi:hypothetical protein
MEDKSSLKTTLQHKENLGTGEIEYNEGQILTGCCPNINS